jgi:hypothetical protein
MRLVLAALVAVATAATLLHTAPPAAAYPGAPWFEPAKPYTQNFPDPSIVWSGGTAYAYATSTGGAYLPVMTSTDLRTWTARPKYAQPSCVGGSVDPYFNDALPCPARWAPDRNVGGRLKKEAWAPGAARIGNRWVVFYSVRQRLDRDRFCISVATSTSPLGPFTDDTSGPLVCDADPNGSIDPQPFVDTDGTPYLLWKSEGVPGSMPTRIWGRRLDASGTTFTSGSTARELLRTSQGWEGNVIENPAMVRHQGRLLLFYSGNEHRSARYATGYATCSSPLGPCTKSGANPVLASRGSRLGPGGPAPFVDGQGRLLLGYHWWNAPHTSYPAFPDCQRSGTCATQGQRRLGVGQVVTSGSTLTVTDTLAVVPPARPIDPACPADRAAGAGFVDTRGNSHARAIDCVAHWDVARGTGGGRYQPAAPVTRAQMATFIARTLERSGYRLPADPPRRFPDTAGSPHATAIDQLAAIGIVGGRADGSFGPLAAVDRAQMATFLVRATELRTGRTLPTTRNWFADDDRSPHAGAIDKAASAGLTTGRPDGTYGPTAAVPRDQMASFLARTLALLVEGGHARVP